LEAAFDVIRNSPGASPESITLFVDPSGPLQAPPIAALKGMATLLQRAYPDRIHKITVGPVNFVVRSLYRLVAHLLSKASRDKMTLVGVRPTLASLRPRSQSDAKSASPSMANQAQIRHDSDLSTQSPQGIHGSVSKSSVSPPLHCLLGDVGRSTTIDDGGKVERVLSSEYGHTPLVGKDDKSKNRFFSCEEDDQFFSCEEVDVLQLPSTTVRAELARSSFSFIFSCCYCRSVDSE